jgi:hypothetical protein
LDVAELQPPLSNGSKSQLGQRSAGRKGSSPLTSVASKPSDNIDMLISQAARPVTRLLAHIIIGFISLRLLRDKVFINHLKALHQPTNQHHHTREDMPTGIDPNIIELNSDRKPDQV